MGVQIMGLSSRCSPLPSPRQGTVWTNVETDMGFLKVPAGITYWG